MYLEVFDNEGSQVGKQPGGALTLRGGGSAGAGGWRRHRDSHRRRANLPGSEGPSKQDLLKRLRKYRGGWLPTSDSIASKRIAAAKPLVDTNVVLHLLSSDAVKAGRAEEVLLAGPVTSIQVLNEAAHVMRRKWQCCGQTFATYWIASASVQSHLSRRNAVDIAERPASAFMTPI